MHSGRIGDPDLLPEGVTNVGPSPVAAAGQVYTHAGPKSFPVPYELSGPQIETTVADFASAARHAVEAGFDGVEIHGANSYLVHQFLAPNANRRTDGWGGSVDGRIRFATAVADAVGASRTGIRLSPGDPLHDIVEPDTEETYGPLVGALAPLGLAHVHVMEAPAAARRRCASVRSGPGP